MKIILDQFHFDHNLDLLLTRLRACGRGFKKVVGIRHGGIHLSKPVAQYLSLPHEEVHISRREGDTIIKNISFRPNTNNVLLVDDIVDDGWTVRKFWQCFNPFAKVATMFMNSECPVKPDFFVSCKEPGSWVYFPWELK
jgi:hypoxanthine phosphoribosyltransferase